MNLPLLQTIAYREALGVLQGSIALNEAIEIATQRTQKLAKRQRTWFRRQHKVHWLKDDEPIKEAMKLIKAV